MPFANTIKKSLQAVKSNAHLNAFISLNPEKKLLEEATCSGKRCSQGSAKSPIDGRLIAIKDNICTEGLPTTCASEMLRDYISPYEATVVHKLRQAGGIIMGKTNMDEFGMGSHSTHTPFGSVALGNASSPLRSAGGSSGGSASAVASGMCYAALGTDTGGSVRLPASYCGVVGFKPSYGMVSRWGVVAYANSLDTVGILGRSVEGVRDVFDTIKGYDFNDSTSISEETRERISNYLRKRNNRAGGKRKLRIGFPLEYNLKELTPLTLTTWQKTLTHLSNLGHKILPVSLPTTKHALSAYYILAPAEASSNLARYDGLRYGFREEKDRSSEGAGEEQILFAPTRKAGFGEEVRRRVLVGAYTLSSEAMGNYFLKAQAVRRLVRRDFDMVFRMPNLLHHDQKNVDEEVEGEDGNSNRAAGEEGRGVDVLISPCSLSTAPLLEDVKAEKSPLDSYVNDVLTVPASLAGIPAMSVPVKPGEEEEGVGMSVGMQIMAQFGDEDVIWEVAKDIEGVSPAQVVG